MLVSEPALNRVIDDVKLGSTDFYLDRHKAIYEVMLDLYSADKPCDELTVNEALAGSNKVDEAGGKDYVSELAAKVPDPGNVYHYAEIVKENSLLRRLLNASRSPTRGDHQSTLHRSRFISLGSQRCQCICGLLEPGGTLSARVPS